ncbi:MAG: hypothetical protein HY736_16440 [Verrucomicrobia bacterium]|nr:hypothetical protein [Verrucomicrobiota bacterium]
MKISKIRFNRITTAAFVASVLAFAAFPACSKQEQQKVSTAVKDTYEDSKEAMAKAWNNVKDHTFDKRDDFSANAKALAARMDVQLSEVRANYSEAKASASRKSAMEELKNSEADYKEKSKALGNATAATWDSGKKNVLLSWDRLQSAYYKARAD